jgi:uncharacterized membrane protein
MSVTLKAGILIGVLCSAWTLVMGLSGWYKDPVLLNAFWVVVFIQIGVLVWGLRKTAAEKTYFGQVGAGTLMSALAGVILFANSLLFTTVLFPHYFEDLRAIHAEQLQAAKVPEAEAKAQMEAAAASQTPLIQAASGLIGTVVTGLVVSLIIGAFARRRPAPAGAGG